MDRERIANRLIAGSAAAGGALSYGVSSFVTFASRSDFGAAMESSTERSCPAMLEVRRFLKMRDRICRSLRTFRISALPVGCEWPKCGSRNSGKAKQAMLRAGIPYQGRSEASYAINDFSHAEYVFEKGSPCFQGILLHFFHFFSSYLRFYRDSRALNDLLCVDSEMCDRRVSVRLDELIRPHHASCERPHNWKETVES